MAKIIISCDAQVVREVELGKERMTIGRHPHNDIVLAHRAVSGEHAVITTILADAFLEDLGSTNGTFVNGQRIGKHVLDERDQITLATFQIRYIAGPRAAPATVAPAAARAPAAASPVALPAGSIEVVNGANAGKKLALTKPLTSLGRPGVMVVVISRGAAGFAIAHIEGETAPSVNGAALGKNPRALAHGDLIDLGGTRMTFSIG